MKAYWEGDYVCWLRDDEQPHEYMRPLTESEMDTERLRYMMDDGPDGFVHVTKDRYEYATEVAIENGRDEANVADELDGYRRMIDCAMAGGDRDATTHVG